MNPSQMRRLPPRLRTIPSEPFDPNIPHVLSYYPSRSLLNITTTSRDLYRGHFHRNKIVLSPKLASMSMAPGPVSDSPSAVAGHSHSSAFPSHHVHAAPSDSHSEVDPPLYTKHHHHYHPAQPEGTRTGTVQDAPNEESSPPVTGIEKPSPTPSRRVNFVHNYEAEEAPATDTPAHHPVHELVHSVVDPPTRTFLPQPLGLRRGLQVPSRWGVITWGFKLPPLLKSAGVTKIQWKLFTHELKSHARMSGKQFATYVAVNIAYGVLFNFVTTPFIAAVPSTILGYKWQKKTEHENFQAAQNAGVLDMFVQRWNKIYFEQLGLHVAVALPEMGRMNDMDVSSTKLFKYQQKVGSDSTMAGTASRHSFPKEARYQMREGHQRVKAAHKARIIVMPLEHFPAYSRQQSGQGSGLVVIQENPFRDPDRTAKAMVESPALAPVQVEAYERGPNRHGVVWAD